MTLLPALLLACTPLLDVPRAFDAGSTVRMTAADVDRDGAPDLVTSGHGVTILYGTGSALSEPVALGVAGFAGFVGDVDGDALPDIIAFSGDAFAPQTTMLVRNLGQRRFGAPEPLATGTRGAIALADFTGDGALDLIIPRPNANGILLRNDGRGHFTAEETTRVDDSAAVVGDVDGDGDADLVHAHSSRVMIEHNDGSGRFTTERMTFWSPIKATLEDLDRDGRSDLIAMLEHEGGLFVYRAPIDFTKSRRFDAGAPRATISGDFNGDGALDLAVLTREGTLSDSAPRVLVFLGDGNGGLQRTQDVMVGDEYAESIATADFNRDGNLDLVVPAGRGNGRAAIVFGRGDGTFAQNPLAAQPNARRLTTLTGALDLDGNGVDELLAVDRASFPLVGVMNGGSYHFEWLPAQSVTFAAGEWNEYGWRTIVAAENQQIVVLSRDPQGIWSRVRTIPVASPLRGIASEDVTGDGKRELIVVDDRLRVLDANGNELFAGETMQWARFQILTLDANRDGKQDLVVKRMGTESPVPHPPIFSDGFVSLYPGRGDGTFGEGTRLLSDTIVYDIWTGNFDGDANADILTMSDLGVVLLHGDGQGGFTQRPTSFQAAIVLVADFDGDGILDALTSDHTLYQGTRGGFVRTGAFLLGPQPQGYALARRQANARPSLTAIMGYAGELYFVDVVCGRSRGRAVRR